MRKIMLFVVMFMLLLSSASVFAASSPENDDKLNTSIKLREQLGFNTNINYVQNINSNSEYQATTKTYGLALTNEEVTEMNLRESLLSEASELNKLIYSDGNYADKENNYLKEYFAGLFLDNKDNGKIKIGIVDLERNYHVAEEMLKSFSLPDRVYFYNASINKDQLLSIQEEITPLFKEFPISYSSVSLKENKVVIAVRDLSYSKSLLATLSEFARKHVEIVLDPDTPVPFNTRTDYSQYLRGGLGIDRQEGNVVYICSSAFNARKLQSNGTYLYYLITAAHCGNTGSIWKQGGSSMGTVVYRNYGGESDILAIQINANRASAQIQNNDGDYVNITSYELNQDHTVGKYVCVAGRKAAGPRCGTILDSDFQTSYDKGKISFTNVVQVDNNQTSGGDSGGSVYWRNPNDTYEKRRIMGVLSGGVANDWFFYSKSGKVFTDLGMSQILTSNVSFP